MRRLSRRQLLAATGTAASIGLAGCTSSADDEEALRLPVLDVPGSEGEEIRLEPDGEVALIDFFATWCPPCEPQMAELSTVQDAYPDLHLVSVTWESDEEAIESFWVDNDGSWPVVQDTEMRAAERYDVTQLPTKVLLTADGEEHWRHSGLERADAIGEQIDTAQE